MFSTIATWNWRGRQRKASAESRQVVHQTGRPGSKRTRSSSAGSARTCSAIARAPPGSAKKVIAPPTASAAAELDRRFGRDREHQPAVVLGGVDAAHAEEHAEDRERRSDDEGRAGRYAAPPLPSPVKAAKLRVIALSWSAK